MGVYMLDAAMRLDPAKGQLNVDIQNMFNTLCRVQMLEDVVNAIAIARFRLLKRKFSLHWCGVEEIPVKSGPCRGRGFGGPRSATMAPAQHPSRPRMRWCTTIW